jgi:transcriptional regulator with XRE-family HTH domain
MVKTLGSDRHKMLISIIKSKRETAGLTQAELAEALGEYQSYVARLESGQRRVDIIELVDLASILKFDAAKVVKALAKMRE